MNDRGEYRAIRRVLLDGPDFQRLSERARWVFVALKLNMGPAGIEVHYPAALAAMLSAQTGASVDQVGKALDQLEAAGWIAREGNVVSVLGHLENDPHVKASDDKHRKGVQRHIAGLPRLALVRGFITARPLWFPEAEARQQGLAWAFDGPPMAQPSREPEPEPEPEPESESEGAGAADAPPRPERENWVASLTETWRKEVGHVEPGHLGTKLKSYVAKHGVETVRQAMELYAVERKAMQKPGKFAWFLDDIATWIDGATDPMVIDGVLTPFAERMSRAAAKNGAHA